MFNTIGDNVSHIEDQMVVRRREGKTGEPQAGLRTIRGKGGSLKSCLSITA